MPLNIAYDHRCAPSLNPTTDEAAAAAAVATIASCLPNTGPTFRSALSRLHRHFFLVSTSKRVGSLVGRLLLEDGRCWSRRFLSGGQ